MKPIIRWAGSKRKLLSPLEEMWIQSESKRYVEPFCGSACLFFHIEPESAVLGDTNEWLINTYESIKNKPDHVTDRLHTLTRSKKLYNKIRSYHYSRFSSINSAAYFLYINRLCFNGLFRTNKKQIFNVPYSNIRTGSFPERNSIRRASSLLNRCELVRTDFHTTVQENVKKGDFVYLDPPYATNNARIFRQYNSSTFGVEDIYRLDEALNYIDKLGARFVLSYACADEIDFISKKWDTTNVSVQRNIAGFSNKRKIEKEIILKNF